MLIRFVVHKNDEDSGRRMGLFQMAGELRESGRVNQFEEVQLLSVGDWFNANLNRPQSFAKSNKTHAKKVAISWFKDSAKQHISKMYEFAAILKTNGIDVEVIKTFRPGYIVYEDDYQVVAEPYAETKT